MMLEPSRTIAVEPRFEAGWMSYTDDLHGAGFVAFLRPWSENWYEMFHFPTWWAAQKHALDLAQRVADCEYIGGPNFGGER